MGEKVRIVMELDKNVVQTACFLADTQTVYSIYVVELKHDSIQNNIHEAFYQDTSFSWNDRCCICRKSFFYL